jgi:hypothetical protein
MDQVYLFPENKVFRPPNALNQGKFCLMKSMFIIDGYNVPRSGRCDNMTYSVESTTFGTEFEDEDLHVGKYSPYLDMTLSPHHVGGMEVLLDASPLFCIIVIRFSTPRLDGGTIFSPEIQEGEYPASTRGASSLVELFKNLREWSLMVEEPFNSEHPHAVYSKLFFDTLSTPQSILDEIDSMPDMHLARFLKGDENHTDKVDGFPQMSEEMISWFKTKLEQFPRKTTSERLEEIII